MNFCMFYVKCGENRVNYENVTSLPRIARFFFFLLLETHFTKAPLALAVPIYC